MLKTLKTFYKFAAEKRLVFAGFILLVIISNLLYNLTPYFYKLFVDGIPGGDYNLLFSILLLYMAARIGSFVTDQIGELLGDSLMVDSASKIRLFIFKQVQDLDFAFHSNKSTGSLISAFKRGDGAFFDIFETIHHRITNVLVSVVVMFYFFYRLDPRIAMIAIVSILATIASARFLIQLNVTRRRAHNEQEDYVSSIITDNLINYETVKLFSKETWEQSRLSESFKRWKSTLWRYFVSFRIIDVTIGGIINASVFVILVLILKGATSMKIDVGEFVLVTAFINSFFPHLWELVWAFRGIAKNYTDIEKYFGLLDYGIEVKDPENPVKKRHVLGDIKFKNVSFAYGERKSNAINGLTLDIKKGESVALIGRSGSGKTTMVKLLMRFYDLDKGDITIDEVNIKDFTKANLRGFMGVVPQEPILFNNTVAYNIGYGKTEATLKEIRDSAKIANIDTFIESMPKKYDTEVGERGVKLSGGQKQRLAIARMILSDPDIVIFDEATSHLDSESEKLIQDAFWKARHGKTTIIVAHRLSTIMRADKIVVMENGRIKEIGTHTSLLKNKDSLYSHFWNLQIKLD
jgi:ATP-binding cassette subfamily B protein